MSVAMRERYFRKKDSKGQYDPQVGQAASANAAVAERAQAWTEDFYEKYIGPALDVMSKETETNIDRQGQLFDLNMSQARLQDERYRSKGLPAEDRYYNMVDEYSAPEEQERQAQRALGDVRVAANTREQEQRRKLRGLGVDPTSPAAMSAMTDIAVQDAAVEAAAATRARDAAKALGMTLTADAANFGRGTASQVLGFGGAAGGQSSAALAGAQGSTGAATGAASPMAAAQSTAQRAYGANLDAYSGLNKASMESQASASAGVGKLLGLAANVAIGSDRTIKKNAIKVFEVGYGIGVWLFHYLWDANDAPLRKGFMADEVERVFPGAIVTGPGGVKMVNYSKVTL